MFEFSDIVREDIISAMTTRTPFLRFADGAYAVSTGPRDSFYLLILPGPNGRGHASATIAQRETLRRDTPCETPPIWMDLSDAGSDGEGILLVQGPPADRCVSLAAREDVDHMLTALRAHDALRDMEAEDFWVNTENNRTFLFRVDRLAP